MTHTKPFVKWAGGKGQLIDRIFERLPKSFNSYYEPFIGGGALLFYLQPANAYINDINSELINTYNTLKNDVSSLISQLKDIDEKHVGDIKNYYYTLREEYNNKIVAKEFDVRMAALFIYINKHCFNGLYRVNGRGLFNVPFNQKKTGDSFDESNLLNISKYLSSVSITNYDFEKVCTSAQKGDFVFFDSPYAPLNSSSFENYTKEGFCKEDHIRLCELFKSLSSRGVYCMLTNHNTEFINDLYRGFSIDVVPVKRMINSDSNNRIGEEVIITNY